MQLIFKKFVLGKVSLYFKLIVLQIKTRFRKAQEYSVPRCGVSFAQMKRIADNADAIKIVEDQDTKATTFRVTSKSPEAVYGFVSQIGEHIVSSIKSPSRKDQKRLNELGAYIKQLEPQMQDLELYKQAGDLLK